MNDKLIKDEIHPTSNPATLNDRLKCHPHTVARHTLHTPEAA